MGDRVKVEINCGFTAGSRGGLTPPKTKKDGPIEPQIPSGEKGAIEKVPGCLPVAAAENGRCALMGKGVE